VREVRIATRGSALALWQARWVAARLEPHGCAVRLVVIETQGDRERIAFAAMKGQGFFTKAVQDAVLENRADLAVHSFKDLPSAVMPGLTIGAIPEREDPREMLLVHPDAVLDAVHLPIKPAARVGSSAVRRQAQLKHLRPDLELAELRGNVPTRVQKLRQGRYDAVVLAWAGVKRLELDLSDLYTQILQPELLVPAPAQGALALECRTDDAQLLGILHHLNHPPTQKTVMTERGLMARLAGGCQLALGASARLEGDEIKLMAWYKGKIYRGHGSSVDRAVQAVYQQLRAEHPESALQEQA
jgi:hydroxymethylbilane synthase